MNHFAMLTNGCWSEDDLLHKFLYAPNVVSCNVDLHILFSTCILTFFYSSVLLSILTLLNVHYTGALTAQSHT
jgi:hypothetical protein